MTKNTVNNRVQAAINFFRPRIGHFIPWIVGGVLAISSQFAATAAIANFEHYIGISTNELNNKQLYWNYIYIAVFFIALWVFYLTSKSIFRARTRIKEDELPTKRENLFIILSNIDSKVLDICDEYLIPSQYSLERKGLESLDKDIKEMMKHKIAWSWQMLLIAIKYHIGNDTKPFLKNIIAVCSPESLKQFDAFKNMLEPYIKDTPIQLRLLAIKDYQKELLTIEKIQNEINIDGTDFEDFDNLTDLIYFGIKQLKKEGQKEKNMVVDITGGQKVASIVAATLTFNTNIKAQYVSTNNYFIKSYDVTYGTNKFR